MKTSGAEHGWDGDARGAVSSSSGQTSNEMETVTTVTIDFDVVNHTTNEEYASWNVDTSYNRGFFQQRLGAMFVFHSRLIVLCLSQLSLSVCI